jgi:nucleotide-binding universal stress UspA family protein
MMSLKEQKVKLPYKKIVIAVNPEEECLGPLKEFAKSVDFGDAQIHLVHVFEIRHYMNEFAAYEFPQENNMPEIEKGIITLLDNVEKELFSSSKPRSVEKHCLFNASPADGLVDYTNDKKIDLVVVPTRGKKGIAGLFSTSFAHHMCQFTKCPVFVLK